MRFGWRYFLRRVLVAVFLVWVLSLITFALYFTIPDEPADFLVDTQHATRAQIADARHKLGVDRPVYVQYGKFVSRLLHGDLGHAWSGISFDPLTGKEGGTPVRDEVLDSAAVTGSLAAGGVVLLLLLAVPGALLAASRAGTLLDRGLLTLSLVGVSLHPIILGMILQTFFGNRWHIAPPNGYCPLTSKVELVTNLGISKSATCGGVTDWTTHMILPWITFALFFVALYLRMIRVRLLEVLGSEYVRAARAKGNSEGRVLRKHALPNTYLPTLTMIGMDIGTAVGIAIYVETVYQLPGLGRLTIASMGGESALDLPTIIGVVLFIGAAIILLNLLVDFIYAFADPTIRTRGEGQRAAAVGHA
jgi:peptide/nickel transport system permease protein